MYKNYENYAQYPPDNEEVVRKYSYDLMSSSDMEHALSRVEVIIVDAWAPWCRPCKTASQKFEALGEKFNKQIENKRLLLLKDNIDNEEASHHRTMVDVVPTFFVYIRGRLATMFTGIDFDRLSAYIVNYFSSNPDEAPVQNQQQDYYTHDKTPYIQQSTRSMPQIKQNTIQYPPKNM